MDQGLRDEAIKEMELALKSFKLRLQNKEVELASLASPDDNDLARKSIAEMKDVIADMEQRVCGSHSSHSLPFRSPLLFVLDQPAPTGLGLPRLEYTG